MAKGEIPFLKCFWEEQNINKNIYMLLLKQIILHHYTDQKCNSKPFGQFLMELCIYAFHAVFSNNYLLIGMRSSLHMEIPSGPTPIKSFCASLSLTECHSTP